jgi:hypothetical protein
MPGAQIAVYLRQQLPLVGLLARRPQCKVPLKICTFERYSARLMRKSELV